MFFTQSFYAVTKNHTTECLKEHLFILTSRKTEHFTDQKHCHFKLHLYINWGENKLC